MECSKPHTRSLRKGRVSRPGLHYFLTTTVAGRRKIFTEQDNAVIVLDAIRWLRATNRFAVDAAVVMPDHLHIVGQLCEANLARVQYLIQNPLRAGLVKRIEDYPYVVLPRWWGDI